MLPHIGKGIAWSHSPVMANRTLITYAGLFRIIAGARFYLEVWSSMHLDGDRAVDSGTGGCRGVISEQVLSLQLIRYAIQKTRQFVKAVRDK